MAGPYNCKAVANWILDKFWEAKRDCTQLQINKLVYMAHGWHLGFDTRPSSVGLIDDEVVAWKYGPVIPELRAEFREYGSSPITRPATIWVDEGSIYTPSLQDSPVAEWESNLLEWVWQQYGPADWATLIAVTHKEGSPWAVVTKNGTDIGYNRIIPRSYMREYYGRLREQLPRSPTGR